MNKDACNNIRFDAFYYSLTMGNLETALGSWDDVEQRMFNDVVTKFLCDEPYSRIDANAVMQNVVNSLDQNESLDLFRRILKYEMKHPAIIENNSESPMMA